MKIICLYLSFLLLGSPTITHLMAQPQLDSYEDGVYRDYIRSVKLHVTGLALTDPVVKLGSMNSLWLSFDELDGTGNRYYYTVIHCDRHWQPTPELTQFDYLNGFREGQIINYEISTGTYQDYLHYYVSFPNDELKWSISGNYLLVVYEAGYEDDPIITRRFMVSEDLVTAKTDVVRSAVVALQNTHQEIDFWIETKALQSYNPRMEIFCTLIQNGRWDMRIEDITPRLVNDVYLDFNYQGKIIFPAGKEFRNMDISSMVFKSENVLDIEEFVEGYSTILFPDEPRDRMAYLWRQDLNGKFVPYNRDFFRKTIPPDSLASSLNLALRHNYREQQLNTEYTEVLITLKIPYTLDKDVYVVGGMTDWKMLPEYKLTYDERIGGYIGRLYLKQGYYNYGYAIAGPQGLPEFSPLEGDWYTTENQYTILTYYRPLGAQFDRLIGAKTFDTYY